MAESFALDFSGRAAARLDEPPLLVSDTVGGFHYIPSWASQLLFVSYRNNKMTEVRLTPIAVVFCSFKK